MIIIQDTEYTIFDYPFQINKQDLFEYQMLPEDKQHIYLYVNI